MDSSLRPDTTPDQELARLARLLDIGAGHFSLSVALCNSSTWRDQLIAQLREQHPGIVAVDLPEKVGDVYHYVRAQQPDPPAEALFITEQTVKNHMTSVMRKLEVTDRVAALRVAMANGWSCLGIPALVDDPVVSMRR